MKRLLRGLLQLLGIALVSLLLLEVALRVVDPLGISDLHNQRVLWNKLVRFDEQPVGKRLIPETSAKLRGWDLQTNSLGFRDEEFPLAKPAGERRVLFLGDSFVFGHGAPQASLAANHLERRLAHETGVTWQVINTGLGSYATHEQRLIAEEYAEPLDVDMLLLLYTFNDCDGRFVRLAPWHELPDYVPQEAIDRARRRDPLNRNEGLRARLRPLKTALWPRLFDVATWLRKGTQQALPGASRGLDTSDWAWRFSTDNLLAVRDLAHDLSVPLLVTFMNHGSGDDPDAYPLQVARELERFCASAGIDFADLREPSLRLGLGDHPNSRVDGHPNAEGQEILAEILFAELAEMEWFQRLSAASR